MFAWALLGSVFFNIHRDFKDVLLSGGGWFVSCIMIYYVILWFVRRYMINQLKTVFALSTCVVVLWFFMMPIPDGFNMYGATYFKWCFFFLFMLQGAMLGRSVQQHAGSLFKYGLSLLVCIIAYYGLCALRLCPDYSLFQIFSLLPLLGVTYCFYRGCNSAQMIKIYRHRLWGWLIRFIGGLCLEIYLVQTSLFTDKMNAIFPFNIPIMFVIILIAAYLLRCLSRIWSQTFKEQDYEWNSVFTLL